ncbi:MAG TPA: PAS domain-containing protein [Herpetosiphonaceae bacterium]|nr:PAS domain-containing protein [Herpetosiphonaceae bacterium]
MTSPTPPDSLLPLVLDTLPGVIFWKDRNSVYLGCNEAFAQAAGLPNPAAVVGLTDHDLPWTAEQIEFFLLVDRRVMDSDTPEYNIHEQLTNADGTTSWVETTKLPLHGPDGSVIGILGTYVDITERKNSELEQQRMSAVIENSLDFMGIASMDGQVLYINPAGRRLVGLDSPEEALRLNTSDLYSEQDLEFLASNIFPDVIGKGQWGGEFRVRHLKTGEVLPVYYTLFTIKDHATDQPIAIASVMRDLREQRRLEADRQRATVQEEIIQAQNMILAELSTPLIPITEGIVIMPLIGTMDTRRAQQALEALLDGVSTTRAHTAIVDITGVPVVDTQVANALLQATQATKLLGAEVLLTGIRPEVAQTLVGLGVELRNIQTYSNLQQGIAVALRRYGRDFQ